jgi:hypothetical protein
VDAAKWKVMADETVNEIKAYVQRAIAPVEQRLASAADAARVAELQERIEALEAEVERLRRLRTVA